MTLEARLEAMHRELADAEARPSFWQRLGARLLALREGHAVLEARAMPERRNLAGLVHGGEAAALIDQAAGLAANACPEGRWVTAEANLRYVRPLPGDVPLRCEARVADRTGRVARVEASVRGVHDEDPAVTATLVFVRLRQEHHGRADD